MNNVEKLAELLSQNAELYEQMAKVAEEEKSALESASLDGLNTAGKKKETLVLKIRMLEESRLKLMEEIGREMGQSAGDITLQGLAESPENRPLRKNLLSIRDRLGAAVERVGELNGFNLGLVSRAISTVHESFRFAVGQAEPSLTYSPGNGGENSQPTGRMIRKSY